MVTVMSSLIKPANRPDHYFTLACSCGLSKAFCAIIMLSDQHLAMPHLMFIFLLSVDGNIAVTSFKMTQTLNNNIHAGL